MSTNYLQAFVGEKRYCAAAHFPSFLDRLEIFSAIYSAHLTARTKNQEEYEENCSLFLMADFE